MKKNLDKKILNLINKIKEDIKIAEEDCEITGDMDSLVHYQGIFEGLVMAMGHVERELKTGVIK